MPMHLSNGLVLIFVVAEVLSLLRQPGFWILARGLGSSSTLLSRSAGLLRECNNGAWRDAR